MKKSLNILFTCAGRRVALLDAFRDALSRLGLDGKIIASDASSASSAIYTADVGLKSPLVKDADYIPWLCEVCRERDVGLVVPMTDLDLILLADNRERLASAGATAMVGSPEIMRICRDKAKTAAFLEAKSLPVVKTLTLGQFEKSPFYPCFAKPADGSASIGARQIDNAQQFQQHVDCYGNGLIFQELLTGPEFTIDVYRSCPGEIISVVPRQRLAVRSGEVEKGMTVNDDNLIDIATRVSSALASLWGVFCIQCRTSKSSGTVVFEINARFGGGAPLSIAAGADLPLYLIQETLSMKITGGNGKFIDRLLMLRYDQAVFDKIAPNEIIDGMDKPIFR